MAFLHRRKDKNEDTGKTQRHHGVSPARIILVSFAGAIILGTILLALPVSSRGKPLYVEDAFFTATSAVCVTGLIVVDTEKDLSRFGQAVILVLIQLGGLGIMTFSTFFVLVFKRRFISHSGVQILRDTLTPGTPDIKKLLLAIFKVTIAFELWGALLLYLLWRGYDPPERLWWDAAFHSVSAFCNAGFSTFSENLYRMRNIYGGCVVVMVLIVLGGLGFCVLDSVLYRREYVRQGRRAFPLQVKVVLSVSVILIVVGTLFFWALDGGHSVAREGFFAGGFHALFQSVTSRTAGFNTVAFTKVSHVGLVLIMFLMFIGGAPGSTAGGIKTTTAAILFATIRAHLRTPPRADVEMFKRRIPAENISKAFIILVMSILAVLIVAVLLSVTERARISTWQPGQEPVLRILFETISAFGTVGLSTGITPYLSIPGKILITIMMFVGRLGPLTIVLALVEEKQKVSYRYPEENLMVG